MPIDFSSLLHWVNKQNLNGTFYDIIGVFAMLLSIAFLLFYGKQWHISLNKSIIIAVGAMVAISALAELLYSLISLVYKDAITSSVRTYIFLPLVFWALSKLVKLSFAQLLDYVAPGIALFQGISPMACCFTGCCNGYEYPWGIWNARLNTTVFPVQIIESLLTLIVFAYLVDHARKNDYKVTGKAYPSFLMAYGIIRFFMEYMRASEKVIGNLSSISLHAAFMALVGLVWYFVLHRKEQRTKPLP